MSGNSGTPNTMDVDPSDSAASGAAGGHGQAANGDSGSIPIGHGASGSGAASSNEQANVGNAQGVNNNNNQGHAPMDTAPSAKSVGEQQSGTTSGPSSSGPRSKIYHGAFSKYASAHPPGPQGNGEHVHHVSYVGRPDVSCPAEFNWEQFVSPYQGITVIDRLIYIGERCSAMSVPVFNAALEKLKQTDNTSLYRQLIERHAGNPAIHIDPSWMDNKNIQAQQKYEQLEQELSGYKANLIKENVRIASRDLGDFHFNRGDYGAALRAYSKMRDYCSTPAHHTDMNIHQSRACIQLHSYAQLMTHIARAEQQPDLDKSLGSVLKCWHALAHIAERKYRLAARKLLELRLHDLPANINQYLTVGDITTYTTLMALAEFDRKELGNRVQHNSDFKPFLEQVPLMQELVSSFYDAKYGKVMEILGQIAPTLKLDMRLGEHIDTLVKHIRAKALIQYFTPYSSVDLNEMAKAFNLNVTTLEKELADLIVNGSISARIDSHNKRLYATQSDQRSSTFVKAYNVGDAFASDSMAMLLRINLIRNNFIVKGGKGSGLPGMLGGMDMLMDQFNYQHHGPRGHKGR